jgi:hypothetical protein
VGIVIALDGEDSDFWRCGHCVERIRS